MWSAVARGGGAWAAALLWMVGCAAGPGQPTSTGSARGGLSDAEVKALVAKKAAADPFLRSQTDVALDVRVDSPGVLQVTIANKTSHPLRIGPENFAILAPGSAAGSGRPLTPANAVASRTRFPGVDVSPGDQASGQLIFPEGATVSGNRLVFSHPQCQSAMAPIH